MTWQVHNISETSPVCSCNVLALIALDDAPDILDIVLYNCLQEGYQVQQHRVSLFHFPGLDLQVAYRGHAKGSDHLFGVEAD